MGTIDARLIALDGETGKQCPDFGANGQIDLSEDAGTQMEWRGGYQVTSPAAISKDVVIVGSSIADNWKVDTGRGKDRDLPRPRGLHRSRRPRSHDT